MDIPPLLPSLSLRQKTRTGKCWSGDELKLESIYFTSGILRRDKDAARQSDCMISPTNHETRLAMPTKTEGGTQLRKSLKRHSVINTKATREKIQPQVRIIQKEEMDGLIRQYRTWGFAHIRACRVWNIAVPSIWFRPLLGLQKELLFLVVFLSNH